MLDVYVGTQFAGILRDAGNRLLEFGYANSYRELPDATPVSLSLPIARSEHSPITVVNFFEALLTEHGPARERLEMESGVPRTDTFGLLAYVGRDLPGALALVPAGEPLPVEGGINFISSSELTALIADLRRAAVSGGVPLSEHGQWSLAGAQAKVALTLVDGRWGVPFGSTPTTHILKPAVPGFENFDVNEVVLLRAARNVGLAAADAWVQRLEDATHAAVIVRYDRAMDGTARRIHQEDLGQALGYPPWQKYEKSGGPGIAAIGRLLAGLPVETRAASSRRFFDALAFSYAIAGTDGHARNYSLLLSGSQATLTPLYDVNSALPYTRPVGGRFDSVRKLHSSFVIGSTDAFTRMTPQDWMTAGSLLGIDGDEAIQRVRSIIARTPEAIVSAVEEISAETGSSVGVDWAPALSGYHAALRV